MPALPAAASLLVACMLVVLPGFAIQARQGVPGRLPAQVDAVFAESRDANPRRAEDPDLYLVVSYPNMAAFDGMDEKMEPIASKITKQSLQQRDDASGKRTVMRTIMGSEMLRELEFK